MNKTLLFLLCATVLWSCNNTTKTSDTEASPDTETIVATTPAEKIANANGIEHWNDVSEINFTFNVDRGENHFERSWSWNPKTDAVTMTSANDTVAYNRKQMDSITKKTDGAFVNDSYWLLAPYKLVWDEGTTLSEVSKEIAPISNDSLHKLTITYGNEGGYTPGDAYDFFYDDAFMVREWVFRKGNNPEPSMVTTFEDYQDYNGLKLATMHKDSIGAFKLYFTNISVKK